MMTISRSVVIFYLLSLVALSCEFTNKKLSSIPALRTVFSQRRHLPSHSLILLHWFANNVDINNNNNVHLNYDPTTDFRSHYYGNYERLLIPVSLGNQYYTVGNVNPAQQNTCPVPRSFPPYVLNPRVQDPPWMGRNRDRIIVQADRNRMVSQVYLTQHFRRQDGQDSSYDPDHTFELSTDLLQQLQLFSNPNPNNNNNNLQLLQHLRDRFNQNIDDTQLNDLINTWGRDEDLLGLLFLIVAPQRVNRSIMRQVRDTAVKTTGEWQNCELQNTYLDVTTGSHGKAKIVWRNVTQNQINDGAAAVLFNNQMDQEANRTYKQINSSEGSFETSVLLKEGLQVRLHKALNEEICRGQEFKSPDTVPINGYAQLQLFVRYGKACFRIYVKKGCDRWRSDFYYSWVGLYKSPDEKNYNYMFQHWQWVMYFDLGLQYDNYETLEYCTSKTITSDLQARFIIKGYDEHAHTPAWP